jgi:hypothetical protein
MAKLAPNLEDVTCTAVAHPGVPSRPERSEELLIRLRLLVFVSIISNFGFTRFIPGQSGELAACGLVGAHVCTLHSRAEPWPSPNARDIRQADVRRHDACPIRLDLGRARATQCRALPSVEPVRGSR